MSNHWIFKEANVKELQRLIGAHLFTSKDNESLLAVTEQRKPIDEAKMQEVAEENKLLRYRWLCMHCNALNNEFNSNGEKVQYLGSCWCCGKTQGSEPDVKPTLKLKQQVTIQPRCLPEGGLEELNGIEKKRTYCLAGSFVHIKQVIKGYDNIKGFFENIRDIMDEDCIHCGGTGNTKKDPAQSKPCTDNDIICKHCGGRGSITPIKLSNSEYDASNRFAFWFLKQFYEVIKHNINVKKTKCCEQGKAVSWARGMAILQRFDKSNDTELGEEELKEFIAEMRAKGRIHPYWPSMW